MGCEGFEPSTLGLRVVPAGFAYPRTSSKSGISRRNRFCWDRAEWRGPVDLLLTHLVSDSDNRPPLAGRDLSVRDERFAAYRTRAGDGVISPTSFGLPSTTR